VSAQALDHLGHRGVDLLGQADREDQGLKIAVSDAAAAGAQDAAGEGAILVVLDLPSRAFGVNLALTLDRLARSSALDEWFAAMRVICLLLPPRPCERGTAWGFHPIGAGLRSREWRSSCGCSMPWTGRGSAQAGCARVEGPG
jgi:hypothetical protein